MKKKRTIIALILVLVITVLTLASCIDTSSRQGKIKYATEKYGMDEILCCIFVHGLFGLTVDGEYLDEVTYTWDMGFGLYYEYFLGTKDGEEVALIFSNLYNGRIAESEWIFDVSFREISQTLYEEAGRTISSEYYLRVLNTYDNMDEMVELVPEIEHITLDVPLMLLYNYSNEEAYAIVQSEGEILLFNYGTPADNN